jgi:hypothetical protein
MVFIYARVFGIFLKRKGLQILKVRSAPQVRPGVNIEKSIYMYKPTQAKSAPQFGPDNNIIRKQILKVRSAPQVRPGLNIKNYKSNTFFCKFEF